MKLFILTLHKIQFWSSIQTSNNEKTIKNVVIISKIKQTKKKPMVLGTISPYYYFIQIH